MYLHSGKLLQATNFPYLPFLITNGLLQFGQFSPVCSASFLGSLSNASFTDGSNES